MPAIDVLAISHDHWDHLDYPTVISLKTKVKSIVCPLGVGEYFEQWGFDQSIVHEEDWDTEIKLAEDFSVHILPSQHFSGRFLKRNPTLWCGFAFVTPKRKVYYTGDGGYGAHFKAIGEKFGGKFALSRHPWQEPYRKLTAASQDKDYKLVTPEIGELAYLDGRQPRDFDAWWERME